MNDYFQIHHGDCFDVLKTIPDNSIDAVVTDPPYGIRFMGKAWDGADIEQKVNKRRSQAFNDPSCTRNGGHNSIAAEAGKYDMSLKGLKAFEEWTALWAKEVLRVLKPGGHLISFAAPRSYHRMTSGIEDAGFEIRDQIQWIFGSGFPKSHNLSGKFKGWGTALKPAHEPICLARKPLPSNVATNMDLHGVGAINIDECRVGDEIRYAAYTSFSACSNNQLGAPGTAEARRGTQGEAKEYIGRWPANLVHDGSDEVLAYFPNTKSGQPSGTKAGNNNNVYNQYAGGIPVSGYGDAGSAARFFYCAKASKKDRGENNRHPTVKPTDLMRYVIRLVTPKGGVVLDPFTGSGSTGKAAILEGFKFIGIECESESVLTARERCDLALQEFLEVLPKPRLYMLGELV